MKVTVRRSGGFANITTTFAVDSAKLDEDDSEALTRAVEALRETTTQRHPDRFRYHVSADGEEFVVGECTAIRTIERLAK